MSQLTAQDMQDLELAVKILEFPTFTAQAAKFVGKPVALALQALPAPVMDKIGEYTQACLEAAFRVVLSTMDTKQRFKKAKNLLHKGMVVATGAAGGFFGGATMAIELPISTGIMMRSIADVAREEGEDLTDPESCLECISVLGLDTSRVQEVDGVNQSKYFIIRQAIASEVANAAEYLVSNALTDEASPILVKFLSNIAERFGIQLTEKIAADLLPVVGSVSAAGINYLFIDHFQRISRGHFIVRKLERKYGKGRTRLEYEAILAQIHNYFQSDNCIVDVRAEVAATLE